MLAAEATSEKLLTAKFLPQPSLSKRHFTP